MYTETPKQGIYSPNALRYGLTPSSISPTDLATETSTLLAAMSSQPNSPTQTIIDNTIKMLKGQNINGFNPTGINFWANHIDAMWWALHDDQSSRLNWKSPGTHTLSKVNSPSFVAFEGFTGNGTNQALDTTTLVPITNTTFHTRDAGSFGAYSRSNADEAKQSMGARHSSGGSPFLYLGMYSSTWAGGGSRTSHNDNGSAVNTGPVANSSGLFISSRATSASHRLSKNGVNYGGDIVKSAAGTVPNLSLMMLCYHSSAGSGGGADFSSKQHAGYFIGGHMTDAQQLVLSNILNGYLMTQFGKNVY